VHFIDEELNRKEASYRSEKKKTRLGIKSRFIDLSHKNKKEQEEPALVKFDEIKEEPGEQRYDDTSHVFNEREST